MIFFDLDEFQAEIIGQPDTAVPVAQERPGRFIIYRRELCQQDDSIAAIGWAEP
jgi:hypothetical protein